MRSHRPALPQPPWQRAQPRRRPAAGGQIRRHRPADLPLPARQAVTPHVLRHTCAMQLLQAGVDTSVIALWLGHESVETTQIYLHADLSIKERAIASTAPPDVNPGRYRASDSDVACGVERNRDARLGH